jgi:hypothetical protein
MQDVLSAQQNVHQLLNYRDTEKKTEFERGWYDGFAVFSSPSGARQTTQVGLKKCERSESFRGLGNPQQARLFVPWDQKTLLAQSFPHLVSYGTYTQKW